MFWKRKDSKLSGPRDIPEPVKKYIESAQMVDPSILPFLKTVTKTGDKGEKTFDVFIFDPSDAEAREIKVSNYDSVKQNPDLIIAEGTYDESTKKVQLTPKKAIPKIKLFTPEEIQSQIEGLNNPGSSVFFFVNAGTGAGGPLGRGAAVIKLNPTVDGKKPKKYGIYGTSIVNMQPTKNETKIWDSDKAGEVAKWVAASHAPRFC
jgi:hypothetical protein